jgi:serine/threonine-protein kinase
MDAIETLLRRGEIDQAAAVARERGLHRRAAELLSLAGRHAEAVLVAMEGSEWRLALDLGLSAGDERLVVALCDEIGRHPEIADAAAAHARIAHRIDAAARLLETADPAAAGQAWSEYGDYARAASCFERVGEVPRAIRALEQHLAHTPDDAAAAERLAELRAGRGDDEGAVRALQAAVRAGAGAATKRKLIAGLARLGLEGSARAVARQLRALDARASVDPETYAEALPRGEGPAQRYAGRYRVVRQVGSGASGRVLEAIDELSGEPVALKVLAVGDDRTGAFGRFMREAELARALEHPALVRMRALDPEGPTIVYDWMPGGTLAERIGALSLGEVRAIAFRLLDALETLHRHGIVHRDLKPTNVLFDPAGQARLGDLGAAHLSDLGATVTGGLVGSLPYMAPEQITAAPVSAATDLYAFGCVLFEMLTGALPFPGPDFVTQHLSDPVPLVSALRPALGLDYDATVRALLERDPLLRPSEVSMARRLLAALPWTEPGDGLPAVRPARTSVPPAAAEEGARLVPTATAGRWSDTRLGREVELVRLPSARREAVLQWAAAARSDLQVVYELHEEGDELVAWVEPLAGTVGLVRELPSAERARVEAALAVAGVAGAVMPHLPVVRATWFGTVVPLRVLA